MVLPHSPIRVAYFSMEIALDPAMPTYAGGLGVLAGDTLRSAADLGVPMLGVTLLYRKGYFEQRLDERGNQLEEPSQWHPENSLEPMEPRVAVAIEGRTVWVRAWRFRIRGVNVHEVPVYLLDTALPENSPWDAALTDLLYGGDDHYRLCQEAILGLGGLPLLRALGHTELECYHMNEGHAGLLALALAEERLAGRRLNTATEDDLLALRKKCIFTTHTPVPAGHDQFSSALALQVLGDERVAALDRAGCFGDDTLNMTYLALRSSHYVNGVGMQHGEISSHLFPRYSVRAITNGVHALTWTSPPFCALFDRHIPYWRRDNLYLRYAIGIAHEEVLAAHAQAKTALLEAVKHATGAAFDAKAFTMGFARRAAAYKRPELLFAQPERLRWIAQHVGPIQILYGGKAHPRDELGKEAIRRVLAAAAGLCDGIRFVYVEDYDLQWARLFTSGVDLWLNTPQRPQEASGTSGMKAALNGVPSLSVLDGWWIEGHVEGVTGWAIGHGGEVPEDPAAEAASLYDKLESLILPLYYGRLHAYAEVMRSAIALNASFFNTQRMLEQYVANAYFPEG
jgi:glycogen phosphorylase